MGSYRGRGDPLGAAFLQRAQMRRCSALCGSPSGIHLISFADFPLTKNQ